MYMKILFFEHFWGLFKTTWQSSIFRFLSRVLHFMCAHCLQSSRCVNKASQYNLAATRNFAEWNSRKATVLTERSKAKTSANTCAVKSCMWKSQPLGGAAVGIHLSSDVDIWKRSDWQKCQMTECTSPVFWWFILLPLWQEWFELDKNDDSCAYITSFAHIVCEVWLV